MKKTEEEIKSVKDWLKSVSGGGGKVLNRDDEKATKKVHGFRSILVVVSF